MSLLANAERATSTPRTPVHSSKVRTLWASAEWARGKGSVCQGLWSLQATDTLYLLRRSTC